MIAGAGLPEATSCWDLGRCPPRNTRRHHSPGHYVCPTASSLPGGQPHRGDGIWLPGLTFVSPAVLCKQTLSGLGFAKDLLQVIMSSCGPAIEVLNGNCLTPFCLSTIPFVVHHHGDCTMPFLLFVLRESVFLTVISSQIMPCLIANRLTFQ